MSSDDAVDATVPVPAPALQSTAKDVHDASTVVHGPEPRPAKKVEMIVPSHGIGKVWNGWPPSANLAPKPSPVAELRDRMRKGFAEALPGLLDDLKSGKVSKIAAMDLLGKYGIGTTGSVTIVSPDVISRLERQATAIASRPQWDTVELLALLRDVWT